MVTASMRVLTYTKFPRRVGMDMRQLTLPFNVHHEYLLTPMDASSLSDELSDYDVISDPGQRSLESSVADLLLASPGEVHEPPPLEEAKEIYATARLSPQEIRTNVRSSLGVTSHTPTGTVRARGQSISADMRTKRVYVDGAFDGFNVA